MATSKKTSPAKSKSSKSKPAEAKVEDSVIVEKEVPLDPIEIETVEAISDDVAEVTPAEMSVEDTVPQSDVKPEPVEPELEPEVSSTTAEIVDPTPVAAPLEENKRNTFLPLVLGGVVAGAIGFFVGQSGMLGADDAAITTKLRSDLNIQQERLAALETAKAPTIDLAPLEGQLSDFAVRLAALEDRPVAVSSGGGDQAYTAELQALQSSLETQRSEIQTLLNNAKTVEEATADAARAATAQAAIAKIVSAIDSGQPFNGPLDELKSLNLGDINSELDMTAETGVKTLSALQSEFPDQARTALAAARASGVEEGQQGFSSFLKRSLGARSIAPREGNDPDAVLSRAEAAINTGNLSKTLTELDTLPEEAQAAIADWRAAADARVAARAAADALSQRLTAD